MQMCVKHNHLPNDRNWLPVRLDLCFRDNSENGRIDFPYYFVALGIGRTAGFSKRLNNLPCNVAVTKVNFFNTKISLFVIQVTNLVMSRIGWKLLLLAIPHTQKSHESRLSCSHYSFVFATFCYDAFPSIYPTIIWPFNFSCPLMKRRQKLLSPI